MLENLPLIRNVIACRLGRNKIATLNPDMTLEYGLKIPAISSIGAGGGMGLLGGGSGDIDIDWIVSASSSSSASHLSSARSINNTNNNNRLFNDSLVQQALPLPPPSTSLQQPPPSTTSRNINTSLFNNDLNGPAPFSRREKRLPWDDDAINNNVGGVGGSKVMRNREGMPLKAFPLMDDTNDFLNSNSSNKDITFFGCYF